jgi:hypothetical protein
MVLLSVLRIPLVPMCQEGIHLVRDPLPVYPHVKTIQNDEEGDVLRGRAPQRDGIWNARVSRVSRDL